VLRKHRCVAVNGVEFLRFEVERSNLGLGGEDSMKLEYLSLTRFGKSQCMAEDLDSRDSLDLVAGSVISPPLPIFEVRRISATNEVITDVQNDTLAGERRDRYLCRACI